MVIPKKTIIFQGFRESPTFSGGVQFFLGEGRGQMLISIETHTTCDLSGGVRTPLDPHMIAKQPAFSLSSL